MSAAQKLDPPTPIGLAAPPPADPYSDEVRALGSVLGELQRLVDANQRGAAIRVLEHARQYLQVPR